MDDKHKKKIVDQMRIPLDLLCEKARVYEVNIADLKAALKENRDAFDELRAQIDAYEEAIALIENH